MTPTIIESPFKGATGSPEEYARNAAYLERCIRDCIGRGETPYASHKMLTAALDDQNPEERRLGIEAGLVWRRLASKRVFYVDHGWSEGMKAALALYEREHLPFVTREIGAEP